MQDIITFPIAGQYWTNFIGIKKFRISLCEFIHFLYTITHIYKIWKLQKPLGKFHFF